MSDVERPQEPGPDDAPVPPGGEAISLDDVTWQAWHPAEAAERLAQVRAPWCVAGGWALDLFRGAVSREHEDLEIAVPIGDFGQVRQALSGFAFDVVGSGRRWPVDDPAFDVIHQTWVREPATGIYRLDVFREPHDGDTWICRRDPTIRRPYAELVVRTSDGIPYLVPEVVLLFKAKHSRAKDEQDFEGILPLLDVAQVAWLQGALRQVHPDHRWLRRLH